MALGLLGIVLSLALLITLAYRGHSVVWVAPVAASVAVLFAGLPVEVLAHYTQIFMPALAGFVANFFPLFLVGAIFGQLMSISGLAQDLAAGLARVFGPHRAVLVTSLTTALLTYGGVSAWVIVFTMFPIATALFRLAGLPRRLMPAAIALGIFTFATAALPGSPQIHNAIPTRFFGTTTFAAPVLGVVGATIVFALGYAWLVFRQRQLVGQGESFSDPTVLERKEGSTVAGGAATSTVHSGAGTGDGPDGSGGSSAPSAERRHVATVDLERPVISEAGADEGVLSRGSHATLLLGLLPVVTVIAVNALFTYVVFPRAETGFLGEARFGETTIQAVAGVWAVVLGMLAAILVVVLLRPRRVRAYIEGLSVGAKNSVLPVMTTASEVGYGAVIASLAAFALVRDGLVDVSDNAVVLGVLSTSVIAGLTGSASGGLTITLNTFGEQLQALAADQGISVDLLHRIMAMASTGLDSLPHNGAIITLLLVMGLTHRESYKDIAMVTIVAPIAGILTVGALGLTFGAF